uniref:WLM domain-containing protein n=1 Tax=Phaeomonas parva TaxID=124430 RepID=A0A7S1XI58_9STRA|mmetsp:Transcript_10397/g.31166  ORF Transcript_10397/g.31166 Transcript_10397/m.31166 type:complete len:602 (+) Transcript_10397:275-2080(+)
MGVRVTYRGREVLALGPAELGDDGPTLGWLKGELRQKTGVAPATMKLLLKGRRLSGDAVAEAEIDKLRAAEESAAAAARRVADDLDAAGSAEARRRRRLAAGGKLVRDLHREGPRSYGFGRIVTLPGLPGEERARNILEGLASDPGVLAVMKKWNWFVPELCEMYPEGKVGVSEVCVLGLNENHGQRIRLRIRTDDLRGFRKLLNIRGVLFHELAHNEHGDHDDDFYMLMREIEREANALDWRRSAGNVAAEGGARVRASDREVLGLDRAAGLDAPEENEMWIRDLSGAAPRPTYFEGGSGAAGGESGDVMRDAGLPADARSMAALAAAERQRQRQRERSRFAPAEGAQEEKSSCPGDFGRSCACGRCAAEAPEAEPSEGMDVDEASDVTSTPTPPGVALPPPPPPEAVAAEGFTGIDEGVAAVADGRVPGEDSEAMIVEEVAEAEAPGDAAAAQNLANEPEASPAPEAEEAAVDETFLAAAISDMGPAGERLQGAVQGLYSGAAGEWGASRVAAGKTIIRILGNIVENPAEEKFQTIKETSKVFRTRVALYPAAVSVLLHAGFAWDDGAAAQGRALVWKRKDLALVYVAKALLEGKIAKA